MSPQIWYDLCRKTVRSEEEGLAILADPKAMELFKLTCEAVVKGAIRRGVYLTDVHSMEPRLVVNTKREGIYADYTHFIEVLTTALRHEGAAP